MDFAQGYNEEVKGATMVQHGNAKQHNKTHVVGIDSRDMSNDKEI